MTEPTIFDYKVTKAVMEQQYELLNFSSWEEFAIRERMLLVETKLKLVLMTALASEHGCPEEKIKLIMGEQP